MKSCIFVDSEAGEGGEEEEKEEEEEYEYGPPAHPRNVTTLPGPSAKHMLSTKINEIFKSYEAHASKPSGRRIPYKAAWSPDMIGNRMYLLNLHSKSIFSQVACYTLVCRKRYGLHCRISSKQRVPCYCVALGTGPALCGLRESPGY